MSPFLQQNLRFHRLAPTFMRRLRRSGFDIDTSALLKEFQGRVTLPVARLLLHGDHRKHQSIFLKSAPLIRTGLDYNATRSSPKATKEFIDASGRRKVKGANMDIGTGRRRHELAENTYDQRWCCSPATATFAAGGRPCSGAAFERDGDLGPFQPAADDRRRVAGRQADVFTDLVELQSKLGRDHVRTPAATVSRATMRRILQRDDHGGTQGRMTTTLTI